MDDRIKQTIERVKAFMADKSDAWSLPEDSARFVHAVVLATGARHCIEIGTSYGHSGLWIGSAAAANRGRLITIDNQQHKSDIAAGFFKDAGLEDTITCKVGNAADILATLPGAVDFVLNDADKPSYIRYVELLYPKMPIGGVILSDNVLNEAEVRDKFVPWVRAHRGFFSTLVTVGNGLEMSVKVA
jgi:predicted O-methyltransferase YrrM